MDLPARSFDLARPGVAPPLQPSSHIYITNVHLLSRRVNAAILFNAWRQLNICHNLYGNSFISSFTARFLPTDVMSVFICYYLTSKLIQLYVLKFGDKSDRSQLRRLVEQQ